MRTRGGGRIIAILTALVVTLLPRAALAQAVSTDEQVRTFDTRVVIRDVADGSGPSNLIAIDRYLLVVDPWNRQIRRYDAAAPDATPRVCIYPRSFAPWRAERQSDGVRLVAEPYGPNDGSGYNYRPRSQMIISAPAVAAMKERGDCAFPVGKYAPARWTRVKWVGGERSRSAVLLTLDNGTRARLTPQRAGARIYAARDAGRLSQGRTLAWWSEADADEASAGRLSASQYVGIIGPQGGAPVAVIRLETTVSQPLGPDAPFAASALLAKPGFEYVAASSAGSGDTIWLMVADSATPGNRQFALLGFDAASVVDGKSVIRLVAPGTPTIDRQDAASASESEAPATASYPGTSRRRWFRDAQALVRRQIAYSWTYPAGAVLRPCGGADRCAVAADSTGALGVGPTFTDPVVDKINKTGGANWMRPRHLVGLAPGSVVRGIPYSIGGFDLADTFAARLLGYANGGVNPPPIGHIREGMEWPRADGNYPLGIDCSALLSKIYAIGVRSTGNMMRPVTYTGLDGKRYRVPRGPDRGCPQPVRRLSEMRKGDIFLRDGHVVIFAGETKLKNALGGSRALLVLESSSRCGGVCESAYDPTYFAGWWMLRIRTSRDGSECPRWLDGDRRRP